MAVAGRASADKCEPAAAALLMDIPRGNAASPQAKPTANGLLSQSLDQCQRQRQLQGRARVRPSTQPPALRADGLKKRTETTTTNTEEREQQQRVCLIDRFVSSLSACCSLALSLSRSIDLCLYRVPACACVPFSQLCLCVPLACSLSLSLSCTLLPLFLAFCWLPVVAETAIHCSTIGGCAGPSLSCETGSPQPTSTR